MDIIEILQGIKDLLGKDFLTEADTRAQIIDPILNALNWPVGSIMREPYAGWADAKGYIDYLLFVRGSAYLVIEAKKIGRSFELPQILTTQHVSTFKKIKAIANGDLSEALDQCLRYSQFCGAQYACATNGYDWLFFKPVHSHRSLPDAKVLIYSGIDSIIHDLDRFCNLLGKDGLESGLAEQHLVGKTVRIPTFARRLNEYFSFRNDISIEAGEYVNILESLLRFYVEDLKDDTVFEKCYVSVSVNQVTADFIDAVIENKTSELSPSPNLAQGSFSESLFKRTEFMDFHSGRLIVLHGPLGVGKSSFLRGCRIMVKKNIKHRNVIWAQINLVDFRDRPFDPSATMEILNLICKQLQDVVAEAAGILAGNFNPDEWAHLRDIYSTEMRKFHDSLFPESTDDDLEYLQSARQYIWNLKEKDPHEHLLRVLRWFTEHCRLPVVIVLDNSDQLGLEFQEFLYKLAESMQIRTLAVVILVIRTEALASHRIHEHAIASVHEQYAVKKAPLAVVLERRFSAMSSALESSKKGMTPLEQIAVDRLLTLMETVGYEAEVGSETFEIIDSIGNESLRDALRAVSAIFRDSPKLMDKLVAEQAKGFRTRLKPDTILRSILKKSVTGYDARPLVPNIFAGDIGVIVPYTLGLRIMQQVRSRSSLGQYFIRDLIGDFTSAGIEAEIIKRVLERLLSDRILSLPHMLKEYRDVDPIKLTALGNGFLSSILFHHIYYEQYAFDVVVYDEQRFIDMRSTWNSRAETWKRYVALGESLIAMLKADDLIFRDTIMAPMLEPVINREFLFPNA